MGKYGHHKQIDLNPLHYNIGLLGESGIGKQTIAKEICERLVGRNGYIALDVGREDGHNAINDINSEPVPDWQKFEDVVDDIVENKSTDYPELQVIVVDTYDELCLLAEKEVCRLSRIKTGKPCDSINAAYGGYGRGQDKVVEMIQDKLWELKKVGVSFIIIAHVKRSNVDDLTSEDQYTILTASTSQKYFNGIKTKLDFLGLAYIDRQIVTEKTGQKGFDGKEKTRGRIASEARMINFRDDSYSLDSKCRFSGIVDSIPFDPDEFIKAMKDAIMLEAGKSGKTKVEMEKDQIEREKQAAEQAAKYEEAIRQEKEEKNNIEHYYDVIKESFSNATPDIKKKAKEILNNAGFSRFSDDEIPASVLKEIANLF